MSVLYGEHTYIPDSISTISTITSSANPVKRSQSTKLGKWSKFIAVTPMDHMSQSQYSVIPPMMPMMPIASGIHSGDSGTGGGATDTNPKSKSKSKSKSNSNYIGIINVGFVGGFRLERGSELFTQLSRMRVVDKVRVDYHVFDPHIYDNLYMDGGMGSSTGGSNSNGGSGGVGKVQEKLMFLTFHQAIIPTPTHVYKDSESDMDMGCSNTMSCLYKQIHDNDIHIIAYLNIHTAGYDYTLTHIINCNLPIFYLDFGSAMDRLKLEQVSNSLMGIKTNKKIEKSFHKYMKYIINNHNTTNINENNPYIPISRNVQPSKWYITNYPFVT